MPAGLDTLGCGRRRAHLLYRGQNRSRPTSATNLPRQSRDRGASRTPPPTGVSETNVAAYDVTGALSHASQMERGRCPRDYIRWAVDTRRVHRGWRGCNRSRRTVAANAPRRSLDRRRTEDGAPYGRQQKRPCCMKRNGCGKPYPNCPPTSWLRKNVPYRTTRRGRRPRRPFRWMTDYVGLLLNVPLAP